MLEHLSIQHIKLRGGQEIYEYKTHREEQQSSVGLHASGRKERLTDLTGNSNVNVQ